MTESTEKETAIVVYGASSERINPRYKEAAYHLGELIGRSGATLISGGGKAGIIKASIDGATCAGGQTIGVFPRFMVDREWQHPSLSRMIVTESMHERKQTMANLSSAAIACPGGCGTLEELMEIITWRQLNLYSGNVVILNTDGYFDPLLEMLQRTIDEGFMREDHKELWQVARTPEEAVEKALQPTTHAPFTQKIH